MKFDFRHYEQIAMDCRAHVAAIQASARAAGRQPNDSEAANVDTETSAAHAAELAAARAQEEEERGLRAVVAGGGLLGGGRRPAKGPQDSASVAFLGYLKTGEIRDAALSSTDANGGYIVSEPLHGPLVEAARKIDPIFGLAHQFDLEGGDVTMILPKKATHGVATTATETGARSEQAEPTFAGPTLTAVDYYTDQRASQQFIDSVAEAESMLLAWIYEDIFEQLGVDLAVGTGSTSAVGLFSATGVSAYGTMLSGSASALVNSNFRTAFLKLPVKYRAGAVWVMSSLTLGYISGFADPASATTPLVDWTAADGVPRLCGRPIYEASSAPEIAIDAFPVFFGDLGSAYACATHRAVSVLRDPYTAVPLLRYYGLGRFGGSPWLGDAGVLIKSNDS